MDRQDFVPECPEDIIDYYAMDSIECIVIDTDDQTREEIAAFIDEVKASGCGMFGEAPVYSGFDCDELVQYISEYVDNCVFVDPDATYEHIVSPDWLLAITDRSDEIDMGEYEQEWDTVTAYFDTSFGNYLPDYEEHSRSFTVYLDLPSDALSMTSDEFRRDIMDPMRRIMAASE